MRKLAIPFYPILLGIIWVLLTYSANKSVLTSISVVTLPLILVTLIVYVLWGLIQLVVRDWRKSALLTTVIFLLTIAHGYVREYTNIVGVKMVPVWIALMGVGVVTILKVTRPKGREFLTTVGNVVCTSILAVSLAVSFTSVTLSKDVPTTPVAVNEVHNPTPNVYYIIPDTYTSGHILSSYLGYNNSEFYDFLTSKGFEVNLSSNANYHHSILSISSVLNMDYWTEDGLGNITTWSVSNSLRNHKVGATFVEAGYSYVHIGSWWGFTSSSKSANITYEFSSLSELSFELYRMTLWYDLLDYLFDAGGNRILREAHLRQFRNLAGVVNTEGPTFVFCHLILPHPPFLFDSEGGHVSGWILSPEEWKRMYLDQLTYTNSLLIEAIDYILANNEVTPIIVICSDEGYASSEWQEYLDRYRSLEGIVEDAPNLVRMRQGNIMAVLNPYGDVPSSPVNTFRTIFNCLFDSGLDLLPDRYFLDGVEGEPVEITEFIDG